MKVVLKSGSLEKLKVSNFLDSHYIPSDKDADCSEYDNDFSSSSSFLILLMRMMEIKVRFTIDTTIE